MAKSKLVKKAKKFIDIVKSQIELDVKPKKRKHLKKAIVNAVQELPEGKLKDEILANLEKYLDELKISSSKSEVPTGAVDIGATSKQKDRLKAQLPFNFYHNAGKKVSKETISEYSKDKKQRVYKCFLQKKFLKLQKKGAVDRLLKKCKGAADEEEDDDPLSWLPDVHLLCSFLCGHSDAELLQKVVAHFQGKLAECVEECLASAQKRRVETLMKETLQFLFFCHHKYQDVGRNFPAKKPHYPDLLAAILSVYVDIALVYNRSLADEDAQRHLGKQLTANVMHFLQHSPGGALDTLLQVSVAGAEDSDIMVPLWRKVLVAPDRPDNITYSKYIAAVRQMGALYKSQLEDVWQAALGVPAPGHYLDWLREQSDSTMMDQIPEHKGFRKTRITRFLLEEADGDLMERILDLLTDSSDESDMTFEETPSPAEGHVEGHFTEQDEEPSLAFYVDKSSDRKTTKILKMELGLKKVPGVSAEEEQEGEDEVVIDDAMLDLELAKMDEPSTDEEESSEEEEMDVQENGIMERTAFSLDDVLANKIEADTAKEESPIMIDENSDEERSRSPEFKSSVKKTLKVTPTDPRESTPILVVSPRSFFEGGEKSETSDFKILKPIDVPEVEDLAHSVKRTSEKTLSLKDAKTVSQTENEDVVIVEGFEVTEPVESEEVVEESVEEPKVHQTVVSSDTLNISHKDLSSSPTKEDEKESQSPETISLSEDEKESQSPETISLSLDEEDLAQSTLKETGQTSQTVQEANASTPRKARTQSPRKPCNTCDKVMGTPTRRSRRLSHQEPDLPPHKSPAVNTPSKTQKRTAKTPNLAQIKGSPSQQTPAQKPTKKSPQNSQKLKQAGLDVYDFQSDSETDQKRTTRNVDKRTTVQSVLVDLGEKVRLEDLKENRKQAKERRRTLAGSLGSTDACDSKQTTGRRKSMPQKLESNKVIGSGQHITRSTERESEILQETPAKRRKEQLKLDSDSPARSSPRKSREASRRSLASKPSPKYSLRSREK